MDNLRVQKERRVEARNLKIVNMAAGLAVTLLTLHLVAVSYNWIFVWDWNPTVAVAELGYQILIILLFLFLIVARRLWYRPKIYIFFGIVMLFVVIFTYRHRAGEPHIILYAAPCVAVLFLWGKPIIEPILITAFAYLLIMHISIISYWGSPHSDFELIEMQQKIGAFWSNFDFSDGTWLLTLFSTAFIMFVVTHFAFGQLEKAELALEREYARSEALLASLLPATIAKRLMDNPEGEVADEHAAVTILFADIVGFSEMASRRSASEVVGILNQIFSEFDALAEKHDLEKIKTIGDEYMVASGVPEDRPDHAPALAEMAFDMMEVVERISAETEEDITVRIGLHSGPAVAGVIGRKKPFYDIWGDTINIASRMQSTGVPGRIQITPELKDLLGNSYQFEPRGNVRVKGKGNLQVYLLGRRR